MAIDITITDAGRAEVINADNTGTAPVTIAEIGLGTGNYLPSASQTALQAEFKRLNTIAGEVVADDTIHVVAKDEGIDDYDVAEFGLYLASGTLFAVYSVPSGFIIEKSAASTMMLAVDIILSTLNATSITFGSTEFTNPPASETVQGVTLYATEAEHQAGTIGNKASTPAGVKAFTSQFGIGDYKAVADANLATASGMYSLPASLGAANSPITGQSGTLLVIQGGSTSDYVSQVWIQSNDTNIFRQFIRHYRGGAAIWSDWLEMGAPVPQSFTLTIGPTGDLPTLNDAIRELSARYPLYSNAGVKVTLELQAGYVIAEQVIARGIDLSWIEITGVDTETVVDRDSLSVDISDGGNIYPVFGARDGGKTPIISQLFSMNRSGLDFLKKGVYVTGAGSVANISSGCGVKDVYGDGLYVSNCASVNAEGSLFDNATGNCVHAISGATINFDSGSGDNAGSVGIRSDYGSTVSAILASATAAGIHCVMSNGGSVLGFQSDFSGGLSANAGVYARFGGSIAVEQSNCRKGVSDSTKDIEVVNGGIIQANGATGGVSQTANTVSANGIIFK